MNELLLYIATQYQIHPVLTTSGVLLLIWHTSVIGTQLFNWGMAWVDDAKEVRPNPIHLWVGLTERKRGGVSPALDEGFMIFFHMILVLPVSIVFAWIIHLWWVTMWFAVLYAILYTLRGGRRVQKKLTAHMEDKEAHK